MKNSKPMTKNDIKFSPTDRVMMVRSILGRVVGPKYYVNSVSKDGDYFEITQLSRNPRRLNTPASIFTATKYFKLVITCKAQ